MRASNGSALVADLRQVPVKLIDTDGKNLRREQGDVSGLQGSLAELGMLQPITVRPIRDRFEVVAGHRRLAAAVKAGYSSVPCIVREMDERTKWVMRAGENLHRKNLTPSEEGRLYQQLCIEGYTQHEIAEIAGCAQSHVSQYLKILTWPPHIVLQLDRGELTLTKATVLAGDLNGSRTPEKAQVEPGERLGHDFDPARGRGPLHVARDAAPNGKGDGRVLNVHSLEEMARFFRTVADDDWANGAMRSKARQLLRVATQALGAAQVGGGASMTPSSEPQLFECCSNCGAFFTGYVPMICPLCGAKVLSALSVLGPCETWTGRVRADGYGMIGGGDYVRYAHRVAWESAAGRSLPQGFEVDHRCHNADPDCPGGVTCLHRRCVNPAHLEAVPGFENLRRKNARVARCPKGHPYDDANTQRRAATGPSGPCVARRCAECHRQQERERKAQRRAEMQSMQPATDQKGGN